jgi:hypothetical protein
MAEKSGGHARHTANRTTARAVCTSIKESPTMERNKAGLKNMSKYKKVRFFERRKIVRKLKQTAKKLNDPSTDCDRVAIEIDFDTLRKELNYIVHFPFDQKYVSLYSQVETTDEKALKTRSEMMDAIWNKVQSGSIEDASEVELNRVRGIKCPLGNGGFAKRQSLKLESSAVTTEMSSHDSSKVSKGSEDHRKGQSYIQSTAAMKSKQESKSAKLKQKKMGGVSRGTSRSGAVQSQQDEDDFFL